MNWLEAFQRKLFVIAPIDLSIPIQSLSSETHDPFCFILYRRKPTLDPFHFTLYCRKPKLDLYSTIFHEKRTMYSHLLSKYDYYQKWFKHVYLPRHRRHWVRCNILERVVVRFLLNVLLHEPFLRNVCFVQTKIIFIQR